MEKSGENHKFWAFSWAGFFCYGQCWYFGHNLIISAPNWVIPVRKEPLALYLRMSNMEIGIQEVFCVGCVVCVTLIMSVKC